MGEINLAKLLESLRDISLDLNPDLSSKKEPTSNLYLFFSFDLVNSTAFKSKYASKWPVVFRRFYELVEKEVKTKHPGTHIWKFSGDEVLLYKKISNKKDLFDSPLNALKVIREITTDLHNQYEYAKQILFVKATLWIGEVTDLPKSQLRGEEDFLGNILIKDNEKGISKIDFLGPDIDLGFRISKFTERSKITISGELAYLLYRERGTVEVESGYSVEECLKIVTFEKLKGIWSGRRYPIIWFHDSWKEPERMFHYDEHFGSEIVSSILRNSKSDKMNIHHLKRVFYDLGKIPKLEKYFQLIEEATDDDTEQTFEGRIPEGKLAEVHCAAICFHPDKKKILIAKRLADKKRLAGVWEFGCGQLRLSQTFEDCLKVSYKGDFAAELNFGKSLVPVTTYHIHLEQEDRSIPGILFLAQINNPDDVEENFSKHKHEAIEWFDPADLDSLDEKKYVPNFKDTVKKAIFALEHLYKDK